MPFLLPCFESPLIIHDFRWIVKGKPEFEAQKQKTKAPPRGAFIFCKVDKCGISAGKSAFSGGYFLYKRPRSQRKSAFPTIPQRVRRLKKSIGKAMPRTAGWGAKPEKIAASTAQRQEITARNSRKCRPEIRSSRRRLSRKLIKWVTKKLKK